MTDSHDSNNEKCSFSSDITRRKLPRLKTDNIGVPGALISGAFAGLFVDLTLFPLDTIKTRLQSEAGFWKSGGFRRIYAGIPSVVIGSAPGSALFFASYEGCKRLFVPFCGDAPFIAHMAAASVGEIVACLVRVPTEVLKQRGQAFPNRTMFYVINSVQHSEGFKGFYRGYKSTIMREIPFSFIQFPLWEFFKVKWGEKVGHPVSAFQGAICGSVSGAIGACITTPLDVAKTRIMLAESLHGHAHGNVYSVLRDVYHVNGVRRGLFSGCVPRTIWMAVGGFVYFGAYEWAKRIFVQYYLISSKDVDLSGELTVFSARKTVRNSIDRMVHTICHKDMPRTFDDAIKEAEEVQREREEYLRKRQLDRENFQKKIGMYPDKQRVD